jgi:hypothetical protein
MMIRAKDIDTTWMHIGIADELPELENKIRKLVATCIEGFLADSVSLDIKRGKVRVFIDMGKGDKLVYQQSLKDLKEKVNG